MAEKLATLSTRCRLIEESNVREIMDSVDTILCDCDGTLWITEKAIKGAAQCIDKFRALGKKVLFVTNNSNKSRRDYAHKFMKLGFGRVFEGDIYSSAYIASIYLQQKFNYGGKVFCIGSYGLSEELDLANIRHIGTGCCEDTMEGKTVDDVSTYPLDKEVKCVLIGLDYDITFPKIAHAAAYLQNKDVLFMVTNDDSNLPLSTGRILPCCGSLAASVQTAVNREPDYICGKPYEPMYRVLNLKNNIVNERTLMIGDRLNTDILFAGRAGFQSLLVLSGVSTLDEAQKLEYSEVESERLTSPSYYLPSITVLNNLLKDMMDGGKLTSDFMK